MKTVKDILVEQVKKEGHFYGDFNEFLRYNLDLLCDNLPRTTISDDDDKIELEEICFENLDIIDLTEHKLIIIGGGDWQDWIYAEFVCENNELICSYHKIMYGEHDYQSISEEHIIDVLDIELTIFRQ